MSKIRHIGPRNPKIDPAWVAKQLGAEPMTDEEAEEYRKKLIKTAHPTSFKTPEERCREMYRDTLTPHAQKEYDEAQKQFILSYNRIEDEQVEQGLQLLKKAGYLAGALFFILLAITIISFTTGCRGYSVNECKELCKGETTEWSGIAVKRWGYAPYCICKEKK